MHKFLVSTLTFFLLCACSEKDLSSNRSSSDTSPKGKVMRLHAEFSMTDRFSLIAKPSSEAISEREQLIQGSFDQMVEVEMKEDGRSFVFSPIDDKPAKVLATITEKGHSDSEDPESSLVIKASTHSNFSGKILDNMTFEIKRSAMGQGDEISMKMEGELTGEAQSVTTARDNSKFITDEGGMWDSILEKVNPPDPHRRHYAKTWLFYPTLGPRPENDPNDPLKLMTYDAIAAGPSVFYVGLVTSPNRQQWHYKGTLVHNDSDKPTETMKWFETVELTVRLDLP